MLKKEGEKLFHKITSFSNQNKKRTFNPFFDIKLHQNITRFKRPNSKNSKFRGPDPFAGQANPETAYTWDFYIQVKKITLKTGFSDQCNANNHIACLYVDVQ